MSASLSATNRETPAAMRTSGGAKREVLWADVRVRPLQAHDIDAWIRYLYHSPRDNYFLQQLDLSKLPSDTDYRNQMVELLLNSTRSAWVAIEVKGRVVGVHFLSDLFESSADFHAHIWEADLRGKGVGVISWFKACAYFFENFKVLDEIYFRFPSGDTQVRKFIARLPLIKAGEAPLKGSFFREGQMGNVYKIQRYEFEGLNQQTGEPTDELNEDDEP